MSLTPPKGIVISIQRLSAEFLVDNHLDALYRVAIAWTHDEDLAQEVTHRTFLKAFEKRGQLKQPEAARAWLIAILRNEIASEFRARKREVSWEEDCHDLPESETDDDGYEALLQVLPAAFECLPGAFRDILLLRFQQDLSYEDMAQILAVPIGTVMSRLHRAKSALKTHLEALTIGSTGGTP